MDNYGDQAVVWQTAINPVIAMELLLQVHGTQLALLDLNGLNRNHSWI